MIKKTDLFSIPFYDKTYYSGSCQGMRFRIEKEKQEDSVSLLVTYWPAPYGYDATEDSKKKSNTFAYSDEGLTLACGWLNEIYEENAEFFKKASV